MILLAAVIVGFIVTYLRAKLTGRHLKPIKFKFSWLVFLAVLPQIILFQVPAVGRYVPDELVSTSLVASQVTLLGFVLLNLVHPAVWILGLGLLANFVAIVSNGGWMPISPVTVQRILPSLPDDILLADRRLGLSKDWILNNGDIHFYKLADRFTTPDWMAYRFAFSVGDILIGIGAVLLLWSLSSPEKMEAL